MSTKPMEFPLTYDKCPICGGKERVLENIANEEKAKGKLSKDILFSTTPQIALVLAGPQTVLSARSVLRFTDNCLCCGFEYTFRIEEKVMPWPPPSIIPGQGN